MIVVVAVMGARAAEPTEEEVRAAAELVVEEVASTLDGVDVRASLSEGLPWIDVFNQGETSLEIRWSESRILPPNGTWVPVVPLQRHEHDPVADEEPASVVLPPADGRSWALFPRTWIDDDEVDAVQIARWSRTSFSGLELALTRDGVDGTYRALWRTQFDLDALRPTPDLPLAIAAVPPAPKTPPVDLEARRAWDRSYRRYREQARTARSIWVTSAVVGGLATLATITAIDGAVSADDPDQRAEARRMALVYGGVTAASVGVTVTLGMVEKRANERARALGRRP